MKKILLVFLFLNFFIQSGAAMAFTLKSSAFHDGASIPLSYTCEAKDQSPPLVWESVPQNTRSFVLIVDDPDAPAGTWVHWVLFNIPKETQTLAENIQTLPAGTQKGSNSWNKQKYQGPCPPSGEHRYFFKLYALDNLLGLKEGATKSEIETAMKGHVLGTAQLMGKYKKL
jgi:Raf kinase inhibitor-like YbhB/YbcL family protein